MKRRVEGGRVILWKECQRALAGRLHRGRVRKNREPVIGRSPAHRMLRTRARGGPSRVDSNNGGGLGEVWVMKGMMR